MYFSEVANHQIRHQATHPQGCTWMVNLIMYIPCGNDANRSPWQRKKKREMPQKEGGVGWGGGEGGGFVGKQNRC